MDQVKAKEEGAPLWVVQIGPQKGERVHAHTKGEARAEVKARYGLESLEAGTRLARA